MFTNLARNPADYATSVSQELARRAANLDIADLDQLKLAADSAIATAYYCTKAKHLLAGPLRDRKIDHSGTDWRTCGIKLYGLWLRMRPEAVEKQMAELAERDKNKWDETFPDGWNIDEAKLSALYKSLGPLQSNGIHNWNDVSMALRYYVTLQLSTTTTARQGAFDWGGSDGISCTFLRHHGVQPVTLIEPNKAARDFGQWLNAQLNLDNMSFLEDRPPNQRFGVGMCTEVLEHVVSPPDMIAQLFDLLLPGGVIFVTSSFGVPQKSHLLQNQKYAGQENTLMLAAGFRPWSPPNPSPVPFLPQWGFWQRPV